MPDSTLFIFGLGYVGQHLGRALLAEGWKVGGTIRGINQAQTLSNQGFEPYVWEGKSPLPSQVLEGVTHILVTIPPGAEGDVVLPYVDFSNDNLKWVGYLSATSVYGDHQGAWVKEDNPLKSTSPRGCQRIRAETQWLEKRAQNPHFPIHIFRLSGIYGSGRSVLDSIRSGTASRLDKPGHVFSRIHILDIISVLRASIASPQPGEVYNLADDEPAPTAELVAYGCELLKIDTPPLTPFDEATLSENLKEFYAENKRVCNQKIKESLGVRLNFPTYREGLRVC